MFLRVNYRQVFEHCRGALALLASDCSNLLILVVVVEAVCFCAIVFVFVFSCLLKHFFCYLIRDYGRFKLKTRFVVVLFSITNGML